MVAKAFVEVKGGTCGGNNPDGLTFKVLNNNIREPIRKDVTGGGPVGGGATTTTTSLPPPPPPPPSSTSTSSISLATQGGGATKNLNNGAVMPPPSSSASSTPPLAIETKTQAQTQTQAAGPSGSCAFGKWQCEGLNLNVCNYVDTTSLGKLVFLVSGEG